MPVCGTHRAPTPTAVGSLSLIPAASSRSTPSRPLARALSRQPLQRGQLAVVDGYHELAAPPMSDAMLLTEAVESVSTPSAEPCLVGAGSVVESRMDHAAVAARLVECQLAFGFEHDHRDSRVESDWAVARPTMPPPTTATSCTELLIACELWLGNGRNGSDYVSGSRRSWNRSSLEIRCLTVQILDQRPFCLTFELDESSVPAPGPTRHRDWFDGRSPLSRARDRPTWAERLPTEPRIRRRWDPGI